MFNLQAVHNKAYRRATYIERGPAYKTDRKDKQPHAQVITRSTKVPGKRKDLVTLITKELCNCPICKGYWSCIRAAIGNTACDSRIAKLLEVNGFARGKALPEHVHRRKMLHQSIRPRW